MRTLWGSDGRNYASDVATVFLVRHGRTRANAEGILAGRTPGISLDDAGLGQAQRVAERLSPVPLDAIVTSPLERTRQTADAIASAQRAVDVSLEEGVIECHYGAWSGQTLKSLSKSPLWKQVQVHPSSVTFPDGESMLAMQQRAVDAVRRWNDTLGARAHYAVVSHGDVIKSILADALGLHLDHFQRIAIDPCSVSIVHYTPERPFVLRMNDLGSDLAPFGKRKPSRGRRRSDAAVGGGAG